MTNPDPFEALLHAFISDIDREALPIEVHRAICEVRLSDPEQVLPEFADTLRDIGRHNRRRILAYHPNATNEDVLWLGWLLSWETALRYLSSQCDDPHVLEYVTAMLQVAALALFCTTEQDA